jgi:hypothetical protein
MKNMKKFLTISVMAIFATAAFAGDGENELKNFRFGLKVTPSVNWYKPEGKIMSGNGAGVKFGGGLVLEFRLAKVISIQTGAQIDMDGGKVKYNNGALLTTPAANSVSYFYNNADDKIVKFTDAYKNDPAYTHYQLNDRQYKVTYITIPLTLKMKTKEIGSMTYFGQIGVNTSVRWKATANDNVQVINDLTAALGTTDNKSKVDVTKDVSLIHETLNFGLGTELNLSGSTSIVLGLNYNLGFTNVVKSESDYLERRVNDATGIIGTESHMPQAFKSNAVVLTIGVLF